MTHDKNAKVNKDDAMAYVYDAVKDLGKMRDKHPVNSEWIKEAKENMREAIENAKKFTDLDKE